MPGAGRGVFGGLWSVPADFVRLHAPAICILGEPYPSSADELVRQVLIECPERGVLLARVRDELRMSLSAYLTLYHDRCWGLVEEWGWEWRVGSQRTDRVPRLGQGGSAQRR